MGRGVAGTVFMLPERAREDCARSMGRSERSSSHLFSRTRKNYCGLQGAQWPKGYGHEMNIPQDAQKDHPAIRET
jgi:hypothetical protein